MPTLTIRNLPEEVHDALRREAAEHRRSMEEEARRALAERYAKKMSPEELNAAITKLNAQSTPLPASAKMDMTDAFIAAKRIDLLHEEGLIPLTEKLSWDERIDRFEVSLPDVQAFFEKMWPWTPKS
jgi:plasmid stability protein